MKHEVIREPDRLAVTEARRLFRLTGRALRYYEELGLIVAHRNSNNVRWYDAVGRRRLEWIARLKRFVPLHDIAEVLRAEEQEGGRGRALALRHLERRRVALEDELARLEAVMAEVRS
ncbi:MerR family transcriptional regulator [Phenylobacterium sp. VNQ135]|uniref:MerR family transcriptional regulator n=1 Tax=Phenylobacterium sp. VNQ135 TaxID=3400922 RepID=UPI003BFF6BBB